MRETNQDEIARLKAEIRKVQAEIHVLQRKQHDMAHGVRQEPPS